MTEEAQDAPVADEVEVTEVKADAEITEEAKTEAGEEKVEQEAKPDDSSPSKKDSKDGVQGRIDELTKLRRETERDRDYWKDQAQSKRPEQPEQRPAMEAGKTLADFEYDEAKYTQYVMDQATEAATRTVQEQVHKQSEGRKQADFQSKEAEFVKSSDDYMSVTRNPQLKISNDMVSVIQESDVGPQVLYYLGKNESESAAISRMPPLAMAREIGRLEAKVSATAKKASVSKAPAPTPKIKAVEPSLNAKASSPDSDKLSGKDWLKKRNKEIAARQH